MFLFTLASSTCVGAPAYIYFNGLALPEVALFVFYVLATSFAITVGYHRHFAHASFSASTPVRFLLLLFGAAAFEQSALKWASLHRTHHLHMDTERDPYNIAHGFFYAHAGWFLFWRHHVDYQNVPDLKRSRLVMHQHDHYQLWSLGAGLVLPLVIGVCTGHLLGALILTVGVRLMLVLNSAFFINSFAHTYGDRPFDLDTSARDHWLGAVLTNGEGYHNFHHRFPSDYRNGVRWYHWDPSKWAIWTLARLGLARDLRRSSAVTVQAARDAVIARSAAEASA